MKKYGYCRVSTPKQNIERQVRNILKVHPDAIIVREVFTGTQFQGRNELDKILKIIKPGDMIIFDSVSRMCRNEDEGCDLYETLFNSGIILEFLAQSQINTEIYRAAINKQLELIINTGNQATDTFLSTIISALNQFSIDLVKEQIRLAFRQAAQEVAELHRLTSEGMETARLNGKQIGQKPGAKLNVKKSAPAKALIKKHNKTFGGTLTNEETWKLIGISKMTFYKYKKELLQEL